MKKVLPTVLLILLNLLYLCLPVDALAVTKNFWSETLNQNIVVNPYQGLGVCHYVDEQLLNDPMVSWAYETSEPVWWENLEPVEGQYNWGIINAVINKGIRTKKKIWLQLYSGGSHIPEWAKSRIQTLGTYQAIVPWDPDYLFLWSRFIQAAAARFDNDPDVEGIVMMGGGCYGEMGLCNAGGRPSEWAQAAGCSVTNESCVDEKFVQAVNNLIDLYMAAFKNKPMQLKMGAGVYHHTRSVIEPVLAYAVPKYGMRLMLKSDSWCYESIPYCDGENGDRGHSGVAQDFLVGRTTTLNPGGDLVKFGLEPAGLADPLSAFSGLVEVRGNYNSYACLQSFYWDVDGNRLEGYRATRNILAQDLGAKVALKSAIYPEQVNASQTYNFSLTMKNLGDIPPFRPQRVGIKDIVASYQLVYQLIKNNQVVFGQVADLPVSSKNWTKGSEYSVSKNISLPADLITGDYELAVALYDPEATGRFRQEYFRFLNQDLLDTEGRARVGVITINGADLNAYDLNQDLKVNENDLTIMLKNWGTSYTDADLANLISSWHF